MEAVGDRRSGALSSESCALRDEWPASSACFSNSTRVMSWASGVGHRSVTTSRFATPTTGTSAGRYPGTAGGNLAAEIERRRIALKRREQVAVGIRRRVMPCVCAKS